MGVRDQYQGRGEGVAVWLGLAAYAKPTCPKDVNSQRCRHGRLSGLSAILQRRVDGTALFSAVPHRATDIRTAGSASGLWCVCFDRSGLLHRSDLGRACGLSHFKHDPNPVPETATGCRRIDRIKCRNADGQGKCRRDADADYPRDCHLSLP